VDSLIDIAGEAQTRADLVIALRALDRVVRARHDWIMQFHSANHRLAYWDIYGFKEQKPDYFFPVEMLWWYDEEKARAIGKA
jgi:microcin C transport system substrate-binding protein